MSNELDIEEFLKLRSQLSDESRRMEDLVIAYKDTTPNVTPSWDLTPNSFQFNDICPEILTSGMEIYLAPTGDVWSGIFEPAIYEKNTHHSFGFYKHQNQCTNFRLNEESYF